MCGEFPKSTVLSIRNARLALAVDQRSFFFGGVGFGEFREVIVRGVGVGEGGRGGEGRGVGQGVGPLVKFVVEGELLFDVREAREHDLAEEGEGGGFAEGDTVLGCGDEEFAEDVVDVGGGEEIAVEGGGDFAAEALGLEELQFLAGVEGAEGSVGGAA